MTIIRQSRPDVDVFGKRFSDAIDEFFNDAVATRRGSFVPGIDFSETDKHYEVDVQLPGLKKDDISINLENGILTVSGERKFEDEQEGKTYHRVETRYGSFNRSFQLPDNIDPDSVNAKYENGVLNITIEKSEVNRSKKIEIS